MNNTYFIADTHYGCEDMLSYDNRPYLSISEHDEAVITIHNVAVSNDDDVYFVGDVGNEDNIELTISIIKQLNGRKHLIVGNHDKKLLSNSDFTDLFVEITDYKELILDENLIVLSHYPIAVFNKYYDGSYHLYGHTHNSFEYNMMNYHKTQMEKLYKKPFKMFNVGAMLSHMNYTPKTLDQILAEF